ncbi:MAG: hypothetical protein KJ601_01805 [Nanoarchaeota archaeon]|nr:hypothetical protein [Nanoarchaeota archaeon]MBU1704734.1 hypothetical protein [Nanoarchaeota archaeon]
MRQSIVSRVYFWLDSAFAYAAPFQHTRSNAIHNLSLTKTVDAENILRSVAQADFGVCATAQDQIEALDALAIMATPSSLDYVANSITPVRQGKRYEFHKVRDPLRTVLETECNTPQQSEGQIPDPIHICQDRSSTYRRLFTSYSTSKLHRPSSRNP